MNLAMNENENNDLLIIVFLLNSARILATSVVR